MRSAAIALALALPAFVSAAAPGRYAVVAGNNVGAPGRAKLWYAEDDAERFHKALHELGDFPEEHVTVVKSGTAGAFRDAIARMNKVMAEAMKGGDKPLFVVYFSGHAGAGGLEFASERISYDEIRSIVGNSAAQSKIVIVDACEAGALTQVKGARAETQVTFALPSDDVHGTAFIASTAVGEAAQESAQLGGSFFTHHLEVALRGAGDADGDGQVTLSEAFRYTAARTVSGTSATVAGPQHPTYDFRMSGRGDVVLSDLRRAEAHLKIPADPGSLYILKGPKNLLAEVPAGLAPLALALPSGHYAIERRSRDGRARAELDLLRGDDRLLPRLSPTRYEIARSKGGPLPTEWFAGFGVATLGVTQGGVAPTLRMGFRREVSSTNALALRMHLDYTTKDVNDQSAPSGLSYGYSRVGAGGALLTPVVGGKYLLEAGVDLGYGWNTQTLHDGRKFNVGDFTGGLAVVASAPVGRMRLAFDGMFGGTAFKLNQAETVKPVAIASVVLLYGF
jgi:caspase domain-containing protein